MTTRCSIEGCGQPVVARGLCRKHWQRWKKHGDPRTSLIAREHSRRCSADGCKRGCYARELCKLHYEQAKYHGDVRARRRETFCSVDGCGRPVYARGLCQRCYQRDRYRAKRSPSPIHAGLLSEEPQTRHREWIDRRPVYSPGHEQAFCCCPQLLHDPAAILRLHNIMHKLRVECVRRERKHVYERMRKVSDC